jgi:uncharacterized protein (DUF885 family)
MRATADVLRGLERERPEDSAVTTMYLDLLRRLGEFVRERALFSLDENDVAMVVPMPPGMLHGASISNWPAPLMAKGRPGCLVLRPGAEHHPRIRAALLAAHEGIPGHFLQSIMWQRRFAGQAAPVRFLNTADDVAMHRQYYGAMLNIEGFATYAEELMRTEGFYDEAEALFAAICRIFRALRVVIDIGLHTGQMRPAAAVEYIVKHTSFTRETAEAEILRYQRLPMQAATYLLGAIEFEHARRDAEHRSGARFRSDDFHRDVLEFGPVPPSILRRHLFPR